MVEPQVSRKRELPLDGGWGWMVVLGCFMTHVLMDGVFYSFGIFFVELLDTFHGTKSDTSWIGSLASGIPFLSSPLASIATNVFGCRTVCIAGAVVVAVGFILSLFADNLQFLYFTFGALTGFGYGLMYLPSIVCVSKYFEKKRAFATGIAVCGSGVGTFIFNPLTKYLIDEYGWRGTILIEAGFMLNCVVCGALYRPLIATDVPIESSDHDKVDKDESRNLGNHVQIKKDDTKQVISIKASPKIESCNNYEIMVTVPKDVYSKSCPDLPLSLEDISCEETITNETDSEVLLAPLTILGNNSSNLNGSKRYVSLPNMKYVVSSTRSREPRLTWKYVKSMMNFSIFKDIPFVIFVISSFLYSIGYYVPYIYLPDRARDAGVEQHRAAWIVSTVGISNTIGRVLFGFISDNPRVNRLFLYSVALVICGAGTSLGPFCNSFLLLLVYALAFGLFSGVTISLTSVLVADLMGIEMLTDALGFLNFFCGIAILVGPPIIGWLYDATGSYDWSFIATGLTIAFSGLILFLIPCVQKKRK